MKNVQVFDFEITSTEMNELIDAGKKHQQRFFPMDLLVVLFGCNCWNLHYIELNSNTPM